MASGSNTPTAPGVSCRVLITTCVLLSLLVGSSAGQFLATTPAYAEPSPQRRAVAPSRWSDPSTWPQGVVPVAGARVTIPAGKTVLLDVVTPRLASLRVDGSLVADERDVGVDAGSIEVHGRLEIGRSAHPFAHRATLTLWGRPTARSQDGLGTKNIVVYAGGVLELHGEQRTSWLRLGANASAGSTQLTLERDERTWRAGDRLVIASTDRDAEHAEEVVMTGRMEATVQLATPLRFAHWGRLQTIAGRRVDERAEVGLLTRNVVVRGDSATSADGFGGHVMILAGGTAHIEGVGLYRMGQLGILARYPIHWHMAGDVSGQYARDNTIWKSFNRCLTIHGSHAALVADNVCFDHVGHGYFLEDGSETRNQLVHNLGLGTRAGSVLPTDLRPATFWITNPDNVVRGNVAAGSQQFGFWLLLSEHPTGHSGTMTIHPNKVPLRQFRANVAHSSETGLYVDERTIADGQSVSSGYYPIDASGLPVAADFEDVRAYKTYRGVWTRGRVRLLRPILSDNAIGATMAESPGAIVDPLVVGESANAGPIATSGGLRGFEFYDGPNALRGGTFANFATSPDRPAGALSFVHFNWAPVNAGNVAEGVHFVNANAVYADSLIKDGDRAAMFIDKDGTVTGRAGSVVVNTNPIMRTPDCIRREKWNAYVCPPMRFTNAIIYSTLTKDQFTPATIQRDDGATVHMDGTSARHIFPTFPVNREFRVDLRAPMSEVFVSYSQLFADEWVIVSVPFAGQKATLILPGEGVGPMLANLGALRTASRTAAYYDATTQRVYTKVFGRTSGSVTVLIEPGS